MEEAVRSLAERCRPTRAHRLFGGFERDHGWRGQQRLGIQRRWFVGDIGFGSQCTSEDWSANQALGLPDTYPGYGDISSARASLKPDDQAEYRRMDLDSPSVADGNEIDAVGIGTPSP